MAIAMNNKPTGSGEVPEVDSTIPSVTPSDESNPETKVVETYTQETDRELNSAYTDTTSVTIAPYSRTSLYRAQNIRVLDEPRYVIGGSCESAKLLVSNSKEVDKYFPKLIGITANNPDFLNKVKEWLNNISIIVPAIGYTLDTSFRYNKKSDYYAIQKELHLIDKAYNEVDKTSPTALIKALKIKKDAIHNLESSKCELGEPVNVNHYIIYRHCLLYNDIAKDMRLLQFKPNIRFYFKDEKQEEEIAQRKQQVIRKAMSNYLSICDNKDKFDAVYTLYCQRSNFDLSIYLNKKQMDKEELIKTYSETQPYKFNKLVEDRNLLIKSKIEKLISLGDLIRDENNNRIGTRDGKFIAANLDGAVNYFNDPSNKSILEAYEIKLKSTL